MEDLVFDDDEYKFKLENFEGPLALLLKKFVWLTLLVSI